MFKATLSVIIGTILYQQIYLHTRISEHLPIHDSMCILYPRVYKQRRAMVMHVLLLWSVLSCSINSNMSIKPQHSDGNGNTRFAIIFFLGTHIAVHERPNPTSVPII